MLCKYVTKLNILQLVRVAVENEGCKDVHVAHNLSSIVGAGHVANARPAKMNVLRLPPEAKLMPKQAWQGYSST
jgi:hypothetical protein